MDDTTVGKARPSSPLLPTPPAHDDTEPLLQATIDLTTEALPTLTLQMMEDGYAQGILG